MKKNILATLIGLGLAVVVLLCAEGVFILNKEYNFLKRPEIIWPYYGEDPELTKFLEEKYKQSYWARLNTTHFGVIQDQSPPSTKLDYSRKYGSREENYSNRLWQSIFKPSVRYRSYVKVEKSDQVIYDVMIDIDKGSRRLVIPNGTSQEQGVLFFGDSNTFGEGVESSETYASQFAKLNPQYQVFNFGIGGSAPNVFLQEIERLPQFRFEGLQAPAKNIGIYLIIDDTVERMICRLGCFREGRQWMLKQAYYKLNSEGMPEYQGNFLEGRKTLNAVYSFFAKSALLDFFRIDYPPYIQQSDMDFMAKVISVYADKVKKYANVDRFIVFSFPNSKIHPDLYKAAFAKVGIEFWDFSQVDLVKITDGRNSYPWDYHPTPLGHYLLAELLTYKLNQPSPASGAGP